MLRKLFIIFVVLISTSFAQAQGKKVKVVCTLPTLKVLTEEVGGDKVDIISLAKGDQDPHFVTPTPVLMKKTREADLFIENGLSLELWANEVTNGSGNQKIFRGNAGRIIASKGIPALEIPLELTREKGDIHPEGNPHVWLSPILAKIQVTNIADALKNADPTNAEYYETRKKDFFNRVDTALFGEELLKLIGIEKLTRLGMKGELQSFLQTNQLGGKPLIEKAGGWLKAAAPMRNAKAYEFHSVWVYFAKLFGIQLMGTIEERPGIPPGPQHVKQIIARIKSEQIPLILVDNYYDPALPNNISRETGTKVVMLPNQVEGDPEIKSYFDLINHIITKINGAFSG
ncbi:MAG TPA: metal ABC transporter substrate-binding protein [Acidobacteriota bacterium]|nr:metal ABC transporter substrate-binding protein [Acidobacteriota bacterium]